MSLLFRRPEPEPRQEARSLTLPPGFIAPTSYADINAASGDTALRSVAFHSTAHTIASLASGLPARTYRNGRRVDSVPANLRDPGGDLRGRRDWLYRLMMSLLVRGNAYGFETSWSGPRAAATTVDLVHPDHVRALDDGSGGVQWYYRGRKLDRDETRKFRHWRAFPVAGQVLGLSPVEQHATTLGISLRSAMFGDQWFAEGAHPSGMLQNELADLTDAQTKAVKSKFVQTVHGSREPVVMGRGWKFNTIQLNPEESQFIETQRWSEAQCARVFGPGWAEIMGYESGGSMTYANIADRRQDLLVLSMNGWLLIADEILTQLQPPSTVDVELAREGLLQATTMQRYQAHEIALRNNWRTINEVRGIEDLEPVAWGDGPNNNTQGVTDGQPA